MFNQEDRVKDYKSRGEMLGNLMILCFAIVLGRLWYLQIYNGDQLYRYSLENSLRKENIQAERGIIFSRNNEILVENIPGFDVIITPQYLKEPEETIAKLSKIISISVEDINRTLSKFSTQAKYINVTIKKDISMRELSILETESFKLPGVFVRPITNRQYTDKEIGAHLLGYTSEVNETQLEKFKKKNKFEYKLGDYIGQQGIEQVLDFDLRGRDGHQIMEVDARGRIRRKITEDIVKGINNRDFERGKNIRITIDRDMQKIAWAGLENKVGSVIAMDVNTGEILTMVSRPSFDPTEFGREISHEYWGSILKDENNPMWDRNIQEHYSPGSTFKTISAVAGLETGIIDEKTEIYCNGSFQLGRRRFHCWKKEGHGKVNIYKALRESCDVFFYKLATQMDVDILAKYAMLLGFGSKTGIGLPKETTGLIPTKEWKKKTLKEEWQQGESLSTFIGQSFVLSTPIQLMTAYAAIGNGGKVYRPHYIKEVFNNEGEIIKKTTPELISQIKLKPKTVEIIKKALFEVVNSPTGTAFWYKGSGINMAGKTGTSQVVRFSQDKIYSKCEQLEYRFRHHGLFVAFAPYQDPKIAVAVVVEHGCHGSSAAAPIARDIITEYMKKYHNEMLVRFIASEKKENLVKAKEDEE